MIVLFCFFAINVTHAVIIWDEFSFVYVVDGNSAAIFFNENQADDIPIGALGSLGALDEPILIEATMEPVPIPGYVILLLSGIAAVVGLRKRRSLFQIRFIDAHGSY